MLNDYKMVNIHGHFEIYDEKGLFVFSADNESDAREDLAIFLQK